MKTAIFLTITAIAGGIFWAYKSGWLQHYILGRKEEPYKVDPAVIKQRLSDMVGS